MQANGSAEVPPAGDRALQNAAPEACTQRRDILPHPPDTRLNLGIMNTKMRAGAHIKMISAFGRTS